MVLFQIHANGEDMGIYAGADKRSAIENYVQRAGYENVDEAACTLGLSYVAFMNQLHVEEAHCNIEVACDLDECDQFVDWLETKGHNAKVSSESSSRVDGSRTFNDAEARYIFEGLWFEYCNS